MENVNSLPASIKNWPVDDRPREKLLAKGSASLSNSELLAILINNGHKERSALDLAKDILMLGQNNLNELGKLSLKDLQKIKNDFSDYPQIFFLGFMLRYHPLVKKIKDIIDSNVLGKVYSARFEFGSYLPFWHPLEDYKTGYAAVKKLGGGVINTITHELDLIQYFFGNPESVICDSKNLKKLNIEVEEIAEAIFGYHDKIVTLHLDYLQKEYDRNIKILCDDGKITWNWHDNKVIVKRYNEDAVEYPVATGFEVNQLYVDELKDFINLVKTANSNHLLNLDHAFSNTELLLRIHESAERGQKINAQIF